MLKPPFWGLFILLMKNIQLITGIPRSGTTLTCKLLNIIDNVFALHEPINPPDHIKTDEDVPDQIFHYILHLYDCIKLGKPFENGHSASLNFDNPVGQTRDQASLRQVIAQRGLIQLPPQSTNFTLFVKQNALFTVFIEDLSKLFEITCIVRNPIDVLISWMSVDLPVNKGRLPVGERFNGELKKIVQQEDTLTRQCLIYAWFIKQFCLSNAPVLKYEDLISTNGESLYSLLKMEPPYSTNLEQRTRRQLDSNIKDIITQNSRLIEDLTKSAFYSKEEIANTINNLSAK